MKKIVLALAASFVLAQGAFAADAAPTSAPADVAVVRELLDAMGSRVMWKASLDQASAQMFNVLSAEGLAAIKAEYSPGSELRKEKLAQFEAAVPKMLTALSAVFDDPALMTEIESETIAMYLRHFTADEVRQMTAYYRTPVGIKSMQLMPQVSAESMAIRQRVMMPRIRKAMEQFQKK